LANEKAESKLPKLDDADIEAIETEIDNITVQLPELKHFILPGGHEKVSVCHICRTVCRRAERMVVNLAAQEVVDNNIIIYLNRLSDYFFVLSRLIGKELGLEEVKWVPKNKFIKS
jgi:cob(I)alamin adenosyltransferase